LSEIVVQGQYAEGSIDGKAAIGYREEAGVAKESRTATYAALKIMSRSSRWEGVPFFLRSGKRLKAKETRISIEFLGAPALAGAAIEPNRLDIIMHGEAGMRIYLQTKLGGSEPKFRPLILEDPLVCVGDCLPEHSLLLLEAINGSNQWFLEQEEVRSCWRIIDPLQKYLSEKKTPLALYPAGSDGPNEADAFIAHHGHSWF
jgi:glucose-6-phosphate 1-dehydrogenase